MEYTLSIVDYRIEPSALYIHPGELRYLKHADSLKAIQNLIHQSIALLDNERREGRLSLPQDELVHRLAEVACASLHDAKIGVIVGIDNGSLKWDDSRNICLPDG